MEQRMETTTQAGAHPVPDRGIDLDPSRRPGVPRERHPQPWPNTRYPPARMKAPPSAPKHNRHHKPMPPVYGTAVPLHGLSGLVRRAAYRYPDHWMRHWTLLLFADRVDSWTTRTRRILKVLVPAVALIVVARRLVTPRG